MPRLIPITLRAIEQIEQLSYRIMRMLDRHRDYLCSDHEQAVNDALEFCRQSRGRKKRKPKTAPT
jgi:hypothetical protein